MKPFLNVMDDGELQPVDRPKDENIPMQVPANFTDSEVLCLWELLFT